MHDVIALLAVGLLAAGLGWLVYQVLNDGRCVLWAAKAELLGGTEHVFIAGAAGTGKSALIQTVMERLPGVVVLAPTALAANSVGGSTIHAFFKFPPRVLSAGSVTGDPTVQRLAENVRTLVIDEISMVRVDVLDAMDRALRRYRKRPDEPFGGVRVIFVGDLYQLPPVVKAEDQALLQDYGGIKFYHAPVMQQIRPVSFDLRKVYRQTDRQFARVLHLIRTAEQRADHLSLINARKMSSDVVRKESNVLTIVFTNAKAEQSNTAALAQLPGEIHESKAEYHGDAKSTDVPCEDVIKFKVGAQIVFVNNDPAKRWYNGLLGTIESLDGGVARVRARHGSVIDVPRVEFLVWKYVDRAGTPERIDAGSATQYPFKLGWAITAHKAQGQTFDRVHVDIDDSKAFADGQMYVALSRCRTLSDLSISRPINSSEITIDPNDVAFLSSLHADE